MCFLYFSLDTKFNITKLSPSAPGRSFSSRKGPLYGASRESRVGIATLKELVTQNRRESNSLTYFWAWSSYFQKIEKNYVLGSRVLSYFLKYLPQNEDFKINIWKSIVIRYFHIREIFIQTSLNKKISSCRSSSTKNWIRGP